MTDRQVQALRQRVREEQHGNRHIGRLFFALAAAITLLMLLLLAA